MARVGAAIPIRVCASLRITLVLLAQKLTHFMLLTLGLHSESFATGVFRRLQRLRKCEPFCFWTRLALLAGTAAGHLAFTLQLRAALTIKLASGPCRSAGNKWREPRATALITTNGLLTGQAGVQAPALSQPHFSHFSLHWVISTTDGTGNLQKSPVTSRGKTTDRRVLEGHSAVYCSSTVTMLVLHGPCQ